MTTPQHPCPECGHLCNVLPPATNAACPVCSRVFAVEASPTTAPQIYQVYCDRGNGPELDGH